jgi:predicted solute-binding protein
MSDSSQPAPGRRISQPSCSCCIATGTQLPARVLTHALENHPGVSLMRTRRRLLQGFLATGEAQAALIGPAELQQFGEAMTVIPAGCIAARGCCLACRVFSNAEARRINVVWADPDDRTAVALARILWAHSLSRPLHVVPYHPEWQPLPNDAEAVLVSGDRVVSDPPIGFDHQIDLGAMWYEMTGLPLVLSVWAAPARHQCCDLHGLLREARIAGQDRADRLARQYAPIHGWPTDLAVRCLGTRLEFEFNDEHQEGLEDFLHLAARTGVTEGVHPLRYYHP